MNESLFEQLIEGERILVLERLAADRFMILGTPPGWTALLIDAEIHPGQHVDPAKVFVFLEHFLKGANVVWESPVPGSLTSELWTEELTTGEELTFTATARRIGGRAILLVRALGVDFEERRRVLRKARELALAHERLLKETSQKETLLHCLVHDVAGPLATVTNCFQLLEAEAGLGETSRGLVRLGGSAAHRQHAMMKEMLDLFAAELDTLVQYSTDFASAPEVLDCAHAVLRSLRHSFESKGVWFELALTPPENLVWKVVGQREKLERVLYNLLENALRHTPPGSTITLRLADEGAAIRVSVTDEGRGLDPAVAGQLSARFAQNAPSEGKAGLGLFFCRTMIQHWGGELGQEPGAKGGACLWFRLTKPTERGLASPTPTPGLA